MTEQVALVTETTTRYEQRYWIQHVNCSSCGIENNYKVYKGDFPNDTNSVLDCAETRPCANYSPLPETLKFFAGGSELAKFKCNPQTNLCGEKIHRLTVPDVLGDRLLASVKSTAPFMCKQLSITASPYFRSITGFQSYSKLIIICLLILTFILPMMIIFTATNIKLTLVIVALMLVCMTGLGVVIVRMFCKCSTGVVKRERLLELVGIADNDKYADIYFMWNKLCSTLLFFEIVCYREIDQIQLMVLTSVAIRSKYAIYYH
eukprot:TRINITY_DN2189_c0_g3_i1.p1 TRINITY_DN2189_c0_g3~~TRINITY_DN2189_c0_g3_i1.p1  ORF type:complete len:262 (+),score=35.18 TRINITY_DN2189_c0_g3_i1:88-873(+)